MTLLTIRERTEDDLDQLVDIVSRVHQQDRYPIYLPNGDFEAFILQPPSVAAWVAIDDSGAVLGHVALNAETSKPAMRLVESEGGGRSPIYVSRLFVDPDRRGSGVGVALLDHARRFAADLGRLPALDIARML